MGQIVGAKRLPSGNYVIEVKPLKKERVSESGETVQIAGTNRGWAERIPGLFYRDSEGESHQCTCLVQIRYKNEKGVKSGILPPDRK